MSALERKALPDGSVVYRSPALAACGVPHLFTTRIGTRGEPLDIGPIDAEETDRLAQLSGTRCVAVHDAVQVHGAHVIQAAPGAPKSERERADGLVTDDPASLVLVRTADCVPVLLSAASGARVAAVHAGWRGLVAGVIPRAVEVLGSEPEVAAIGPCLSLERFEVGDEVATAFVDAGLAESVHVAPGESAYVDLRLAAHMQLERAGARTVDISDRCTYEHAEEFYSFRRDVTHGGAERTGRLAAAVAPRDPRRAWR